MVNLPKLAKAVKKKAVVPASYLPWGTESDFAGRPAREEHRRGLQPRRTPPRGATRAASTATRTATPRPGDQFVPDSVLVVRVRQKDAGYRDPAGNRCPRRSTPARAR